MTSALAGLPARPRAKWVVLAAWLVAAAALGPLQPRLQESIAVVLGERSWWPLHLR